MKRSILIICVFALLCAVLCGCGSYRDGEDAVVTPAVTPVITAEPLPETSPMVTMDPNDGLVKDKDGVIGNEGGVEILPSSSPWPSASPAVSAKP